MSDEQSPQRKSPLRFIVFLLLVAVLIAYVAVKWDRFNEETIAQQEEPIIDLGSDELESILSTASTGDEAGSTEAFNYFIEARLQRDKARSTQQAILREVIENPNSDPEIRTRAQEELLALSRTIGQETELEELIRAKGFDEVIVYLHREAAVIVVRSQALTGEEVARIADIVNRFAGVPLQAMSIVPRAK